MKKYYEKYKDKMEIIGMGCRDTEENYWETNIIPTLWLRVVLTRFYSRRG